MECDLYIFKDSFYTLILESKCIKMKVEKNCFWLFGTT